MPRAQKGERFGGRAKGVPNKATTEKALLAARALDKARAEGKKLGKEVIEEMMEIAKGVTASHQRVTEEQAVAARAAGQTRVQAQPGDAAQFGEWWDRTVYAAKELAKYQSPTYRAILVATPGEGAAPAIAPQALEPGDGAAGGVEIRTARAQATYLQLVKD